MGKVGIRLKTDFRGSPPRPFRRKNGVYYIRLRVGGTDLWRSCRTTSRKEAESFSYSIWVRMQTQEAADLLQAPSTLLYDALQAYMKGADFSALAPSTQRSRRVSISAFWEWCQSRKILTTDELTTEVAERYLSGRARTRKTFRNVQGDLVKALEVTFHKEGRKNPFAGLQPPPETSGEVRRKGAFSHEDLEKIFSALADPATKLPRREEWCRASRIALYTGLRLKDVCLLDYDSIKDGVIDLSPAKTKKKTKGKRVVIRYPQQLQEDLFPAYRLPEGYVLPALAEEYQRAPIQVPARFSDFLATIGIKAAEGESIGFHSFRVTLVTRLREAGYPAEVIRGLVGHTTGNQTEYYNRAALNIDLEKLAF